MYDRLGRGTRLRRVGIPGAARTSGPDSPIFLRDAFQLLTLTVHSDIPTLPETPLTNIPPGSS